MVRPGDDRIHRQKRFGDGTLFRKALECWDRGAWVRKSGRRETVETDEKDVTPQSILGGSR
jgi:hypothetical protein